MLSQRGQKESFLEFTIRTPSEFIMSDKFITLSESNVFGITISFSEFRVKEYSRI